MVHLWPYNRFQPIQMWCDPSENIWRRGAASFANRCHADDGVQKVLWIIFDQWRTICIVTRHRPYLDDEKWIRDRVRCRILLDSYDHAQLPPVHVRTADCYPMVVWFFRCPTMCCCIQRSAMQSIGAWTAIRATLKLWAKKEIFSGWTNDGFERNVTFPCTTAPARHDEFFVRAVVRRIDIQTGGPNIWIVFHSGGEAQQRYVVHFVFGFVLRMHDDFLNENVWIRD